MMKKKFVKATLAVAAIAAVGLSSYKAYGSYVAANASEEESLLSENIEALSQTPEYGITCSAGNKGTCFVKGTNLICCGEYTNYDCAFSGYMKDYCWHPC